MQLNAPDYTMGADKIPVVNISTSIDSSGAIHVSYVNLDPNKKITVRTVTNGLTWNTVNGEVLTSGKSTDVNSFEKSDLVKPAKFSGAKKEWNELVVELPAKSIVVLELK